MTKYRLSASFTTSDSFEFHFDSHEEQLAYIEYEGKMTRAELDNVARARVESRKAYDDAKRSLANKRRQAYKMWQARNTHYTPDIA